MTTPNPNMIPGGSAQGGNVPTAVNPVIGPNAAAQPPAGPNAITRPNQVVAPPPPLPAAPNAPKSPSPKEISRMRRQRAARALGVGLLAAATAVGVWVNLSDRVNPSELDLFADDCGDYPAAFYSDPAARIDLGDNEDKVDREAGKLVRILRCGGEQVFAGTILADGEPAVVLTGHTLSDLSDSADLDPLPGYHEPVAEYGASDGQPPAVELPPGTVLSAVDACRFASYQVPTVELIPGEASNAWVEVSYAGLQVVFPAAAAAGAQSTDIPACEQ